MPEARVQEMIASLLQNIKFDPPTDAAMLGGDRPHRRQHSSRVWAQSASGHLGPSFRRPSGDRCEKQQHRAAALEVQAALLPSHCLPPNRPQPPSPRARRAAAEDSHGEPCSSCRVGWGQPASARARIRKPHHAVAPSIAAAPSASLRHHSPAASSNHAVGSIPEVAAASTAASLPLPGDRSCLQQHSSSRQGSAILLCLVPLDR